MLSMKQSRLRQQSGQRTHGCSWQRSDDLGAQTDSAGKVSSDCQQPGNAAASSCISTKKAAALQTSLTSAVFCQ